MHLLTWLQDTFGSRHNKAPNLDIEIGDAEDQVENTRKARHSFYREIERSLPGGMEAFRAAAFPIADQLDCDDDGNCRRRS